MAINNVKSIAPIKLTILIIFIQLEVCLSSVVSAGSWCWKNLFHYGYGFRATRLRRDYDGITTRFGFWRRDCILLIPRFHTLLGVLLPRSFMGHRWFPWRLRWTHPAWAWSICDWNLGAWKCVKMRGSAREKCSNLLWQAAAFMQSLSVESLSRSRRKHGP